VHYWIGVLAWAIFSPVKPLRGIGQGGEVLELVNDGFDNGVLAGQ
jgi:hypothetical protein